jgi:hypothetical protein
MSITAIACQAQGIRAGEVIAKLAEDAYFMRVDNRVTQPPPARNRDNEATSRSADLAVIVLERSYRLSQPYSCKRRRTLTRRQQQSCDHPSPRP